MRDFLILIFLFTPLVLFPQTFPDEDFKFSSKEEEIAFLNDRARSMDDTNPAFQLKLATEAYQLSTSEDLFESQAKALATIGTAYFNLQDYDKSLDSFLESNTISVRINYLDGQWYSAFSLGEIHSFLEDYVKAMDYFNIAEKILAVEDDIRHIPVYREIAKGYKKQGDIGKSNEFVEKALSLNRSLDDYESLYELLILAGEINFLAGNIIESINLFELVVKETGETGESSEYRSLAMSFLGKCYALKGEYNIALVNGQQALLLSSKINSMDIRLKAYESLAFIYEDMGRYHEAFDNLKAFYTQKEIIDNKKNESNLGRIKAYYGSFQKELEIDKQQSQIKYQDRLIVLGSLLLLVFILLIVVLFLLYRRNSRIVSKLSRDLKREIILSKTDSVTGLPNRKSIEETIEQYISKWEKDLIDFSMIFLSFEEFKSIDKKLGDGTGEKIQKEIGLRLRRSLKGQDIISLWKPFLFLIILPETNAINVESVSKRIQNRISGNPFIKEGDELQLLSKAGFYTYKGKGNRSACIKHCKQNLESNI